MQRSAGLSALLALVSASLASPLAAQSNWGNNNNGWNNQNDRIIRCESWNYRYARCNADTRDGVRLSRVIAGNCSNGRNWGTTRNYIWVKNGCRAEFELRRGGGGGSTGAAIAGVAVATGLLALLLSKGKKKEADGASQPGAKPSAAINIGPDAVTPAAQPAFRRCVEEAARQIGATGGISIRLLGSVQTNVNNGDWQFRIPIEASWPNDTHPAPATCRATADRLIELNFLPE